MKAILVAIGCLLLAGCSDANVQKYLSIQKQKIEIEQQRLELEREKNAIEGIRDRFFILGATGNVPVPFILDKQTGQVFKFFLDDGDMGFAPILYKHGKIVAANPDSFYTEVAQSKEMQQ